MFIFFKNKGILVPVYFIASVIGCETVLGVLSGKSGFDFNIYIPLGLGSMVSAVITYYFRNDHIINDKGEKVKMDTKNTFFFISMKWWAFIQLALGVMAFTWGLVKLL